MVGCAPPEASPPVQWSGGEGVFWHQVDPSGGAPGFTSMSPNETGVRFENILPDDVILKDRVLANGSGVALGDYDGDGWTDVFVAGVDGELVLYRNLGKWRFHDVTRRAGIRPADRAYTGASFADTDGDGDLDLVVAAIGAPLTFFRNTGGQFEEATDEAGLGGPRGGSTPTFADVDGDGDLDLYVSNYKTRFARDLEEEIEAGREPYEKHYRLFDSPAGERVEELGEADRFFINEGSGRFRYAEFTHHFRNTDGSALEEAPLEFGLTARFHDIDDDGDPDLYVCNDFSNPDRIWMGDGAGNFTLAGPEMIRTTSHSSMGVDFSDVDRDGALDIAVLDMLSPDPERRRRQELQRFGWPTQLPGGADVVRQVDRNTLLAGRGDGTFAEVAEYAGVAATEWSWTPLFLDADLDGYEDLFVTNGFRWDMLDGDARIAQRGLPGAATARMMAEYGRLETRNIALRNEGDLTFSPADSWGFGPEEDISLGLASADLDNDGDLDLVASRWDAPPALYRNDSGAPRVAIRLRGEAPNTQAVGAVIHVDGGPVPQRKEVAVGGQYLSGSDPLYTFAAGDAEELRVRVRWRDGSWSRVVDVEPGRIYRIHQDDLATAPAPAGPPAPVALFEDVTEQLGDHVHTEPHFDDFRRQPLLPHLLSRMGPGLSWIDLDGDAREELIVTEGDGRLTGFTNTGAGLRPRAAPVAELGHELLMAVPASGSGERLLVTRSAYDQGGGRRPLEELAPVAVVAAAGGDAGPEEVLPPADSGTFAALARADVDGDGDLDLFVGGRTIAAAYPYAPASRLYRAEGDRFVPVPDALPGLGAVTSAVFSDLDLDGDPDLVLAIDWGAPAILLNTGGTFRLATDSLGLRGLTGRWRGVTTGDLNGDGRPDIVLTGHGRNVRPRPGPDRPLRLYAEDFDGNGIVDPLVARYDTALDMEVPVDPLARLVASVQAFARQARSFRNFARISIQELVGPPLDRARRLEAGTLAHSALLSDAAGGYQVTPLPLEAQLSAASGVVVADFDGDGHEDVFLAQNLFTTSPHESRLDAGKGLLLLGDGSGALRALEPVESGIRADGEQRAAAVADFDRDGRLDLALGQNADRTHLFRNVGGEPGLRVRVIGPAANPLGIGTRVRPVYRDGSRGPARELQSGSGYLSHHSPVQVFGARTDLAALEVRWPDGSTRRVTVPGGVREMTVRSP